VKVYLPALLLLGLVSGAIWFGFEHPTQAVLDQAHPQSGGEPLPARPALRSNEKVTFLELGSVGCKPCEAMKPVMKAVRDRFPDRVEVVFRDVRKEPSAAGEYRVRLIPTQVFLGSDGTEFFRHEGFFAEADVLAVLQRMGVQ